MSFNSSNYSSILSLNIILHVTILFIILSCLLMFYISNVTIKYINEKLDHIVTDFFTMNLYTSDDIPSITIKGISNNVVNNITTELITMIQDQINKTINTDPVIQSLNATNANLVNQLRTSTNESVRKTLQLSINNINSEINLNINNILKNFNYSYYINIFKQSETLKETVNENLFTNIKMFIYMLVIFLVFFIGISLYNGTLSTTDVFHVFLENIITFILVGGIELWFFLNVAFKFVPSPPSIIFTSLFKSLNETLSKNITTPNDDHGDDHGDDYGDDH